ncbi:hypothetical protein C2G38_2171869 [Gigaspora rosea]|uniref:Uncharacterized protein n=1 Tax=Gigaspora rosea TaxID=44941 RepID=A0A397VT99_9GLOM|nr:hypothetical protein C2G38_2171869 [Gigaspora rosea]
MTQDDASQNTFNVSDIEDYEDISFATESYEIGLEDYEEASFDETFQDLYHPQTVGWPNDAYRKFIEIINKYWLSNSAGDAFITFFNKFSNLDISPLLPSTKAEKKFLDDTIVPYMMFKEVPVKTFQNVEYIFYYRSLIKTIKSLLMINSINQSLVLQYEDKKEPIVEGPKLHFVMRGNIITFIPRISIIIADMVEADKFTNIYQPSCSRWPCAKCLVSRDDLNNTNLIEIIPRTPDAMKR